MKHLKHIEIDDDENNFINEYFDGSPTKFMRSSLKKEILLVKKNKKKTSMQNYTQSFIMLGLGAIFILFSASTRSFVAFLMIFLLGVFFMVNGLSTVGWSVFKRKKKIL